MLAAQELDLPCGLRLPNRLAKAALAEGMSPSHNPGDEFLLSYGQWAEGGWGMILTGNVQITPLYLGQGSDLVIPQNATPKVKAQWVAYADAIQKNGTPAIMQLCHPGRQSPLGSGSRPLLAKTLAPSPVPMSFGTGIVAKLASKALFGTPKEMTLEDIEDVIEEFVRGAKWAEECGFKGIELHAAHGYLLSQFLSPKTNHRTDAYGSTPAARTTLLLQVIERIRSSTSPKFCVGVKLNSADTSSDELPNVVSQIELIVQQGKIDFLEISGGSYENPLMMTGNLATEKPAAVTTTTPAPKLSTLKREAFFLSFAQEIRSKFPSLLLMVTGGFRTRKGMEDALKSGGCDIIGIGRPAAVVPDLPKKIILNESLGDEKANVELKRLVLPWWINWLPLKMVGVGYQSVYYGGQIQRMGRGLGPVDNRVMV